MSEPTPWYSNYMPATEESFRALHKVYLGAQDVYDEFGKKPHPIVATPEMPRRTISQPLTRINHIYAHSKNILRKRDETIDYHEGVTNMRLEGSPEALAAIEKIYLEIGGSRIDCISQEAMGIVSDEKGTLNFWHTQGGRVIPACDYHNMNLIAYTEHPGGFFQGENTLQFVYDVVQLSDYKEPCEMPTVQFQYTGVEDSSEKMCQRTLDATGRYQYRLNFHHPIMEIYMRTETPVKVARLIANHEFEIPLTRGKDGLWTLVFSKVGDGAYVGDLTTTLNASRIDNLTIEVVPEEGVSPGKVWIWSRNFHLARFMGGMVGLAFSK